MTKRNKMVRSFTKGWSNDRQQIDEALSKGWIVKSAIPFIKDGSTLFVEYILEKEE